MFGRKKKENNEDAVVWCPPNESEDIFKGQEKMLNSLAVFTKIEPPLYNKSERKIKNKKFEYKANEKTIFHIIDNNNLKKVNVFSYIDSNSNIKEKYDLIIDSDSFNTRVNPLVRKIVIDSGVESEHHANNLLNQLLLKTEKYVVYGIPFNNFKEDYGQFFNMNILILSECENKIVKKVIKFDLRPIFPVVQVNTFYKNPYFLSSVFNFIKARTYEELAYEIFEGLDLFNNEIEL